EQTATPLSLTMPAAFQSSVPLHLFLTRKPGSCPRVSAGIPLLGLCRNQCKVDSHCPGTLKCCRNGCGKVACVRPVF
uniref:WAP domain-containing protein n=1 Tax=Chelydra serpentina TaxID=8475 RepID=A0A8C3XQD4_CHESE